MFIFETELGPSAAPSKAGLTLETAVLQPHRLRWSPWLGSPDRICDLMVMVKWPVYKPAGSQQYSTIPQLDTKSGSACWLRSLNYQVLVAQGL